ncbi:MAG: hypothetical protein ACREUW_18465 [Burkholderiales bacterium]
MLKYALLTATLAALVSPFALGDPSDLSTAAQIVFVVMGITSAALFLVGLAGDGETDLDF